MAATPSCVKQDQLDKKYQKGAPGFGAPFFVRVALAPPVSQRPGWPHVESCLSHDLATFYFVTSRVLPDNMPVPPYFTVKQIHFENEPMKKVGASC